MSYQYIYKFIIIGDSGTPLSPNPCPSRGKIMHTSSIPRLDLPRKPRDYNRRRIRGEVYRRQGPISEATDLGHSNPNH